MTYDFDTDPPSITEMKCLDYILAFLIKSIVRA